MSDLHSSPGNEFGVSLNPAKMRLLHMDFIYRLECDMAEINHPVGSPFNGSYSRVVLPIAGGTVNGPRISGTIENMSGADWATKITGTDFMELDARYTLRTDDGYFIYVRSNGVFAPRDDHVFANGRPETISQDDVDWFTRLQFDASTGPYNWLNGVFAIGVLSKQDKRINIDAYRITNFPATPARDIVAATSVVNR